jgi:hypothetical protein
VSAPGVGRGDLGAAGVSRAGTGHAVGRLPVRDELLDRAGLERPGEQEPLAEVAPLALEVLQLPALLDPLGQGLDPEGPPQLDQRVDERRRLDRSILRASTGKRRRYASDE